MPIPEIDPDDLWFPDPEEALEDPNGLLAWGGDLRPERLRRAYYEGIFPWYSSGQPILWWSPDPRMVLFPEAVHVSRSMRRRLNSDALRVTLNHDFAGVIHGCAEPRTYADDTWIVPEMIAAYRRLHDAGLAHSVECWAGEELVGGLYGVAIGALFFGESMFSRRSDASKLVFIRLARHLADHGVRLLDCQVPNTHLVSLGADEMPRERFLEILRRHRDEKLPGTPYARQALAR